MHIYFKIKEYPQNMWIPNLLEKLIGYPLHAIGDECIVFNEDTLFFWCQSKPSVITSSILLKNKVF